MKLFFNFYIIFTVFYFPLTGFCQKTITISLINSQDKGAQVFCTFYNNISEKSNIVLDRNESEIVVNNPDALLAQFFKWKSQFPVYVFPGDSMKIISTETGYIFDGNRKNEWEFMASLPTLGFPLMGIKEWDFGSPMYENYLETSLEKKEEILLILEKKSKELNLSPEFTKLIRRDIEFGFIKSFLNGLDKYNSPSAKASQEIVNYTLSFEPLFVNDSTRNSYTFEFSLMAWSRFLARAKTGFKIPAEGITYNSSVGYDFAENLRIRLEMASTKPEPIRSEIIYKLLSYKFLTNSWQEDPAPYVNLFNQVGKNKTLINKINVLAGAITLPPEPESEKAISEDERILTTKMMDSDNTIVTWNEFLTKNLGKVIYIDLWASWCGPCIQEIKGSVKYERFIEDNKNDFVFLHLSIDENLDMWRKSMDKLAITDRQNFKIRLDSGLGELFIPDKTIPKHVLIDKKGKLRTLEAISSANPSFPEMIQKMIDEK